MSNDKTAEEIEREMLNDVSLKADFYGMEYAPFMFSVFKKFSLYKEQETTASDKTVYTDNSAQQLKEYRDKLINSLESEVLYSKYHLVNLINQTDIK